MKVLSKGECFGALEIIGDYNRITEAVPKEKTHILAIPIFWLKYLYGSNFSLVLAISMIKLLFMNCPNLIKIRFKICR